MRRHVWVKNYNELKLHQQAGATIFIRSWEPSVIESFKEKIADPARNPGLNLADFTIYNSEFSSHFNYVQAIGEENPQLPGRFRCAIARYQWPY